LPEPKLRVKKGGHEHLHLPCERKGSEPRRKASGSVPFPNYLGEGGKKKKGEKAAQERKKKKKAHVYIDLNTKKRRGV